MIYSYICTSDARDASRALSRFLSLSLLTESTCTSETTPLHVNTHRRRQSNEGRLSTPSSRFASSNTVTSSLTATTYDSSSATLNDGQAAINVFDDNIDVSKNVTQEENESSSKDLPLRSKIKTTITLSMLTVGLLICFLTLVSYPVDLFKHVAKNETNIPSKLFESGSKETVSNKDMFDELGRYIIQDYDALPPFSDFLPVSLDERIAVQESPSNITSFNPANIFTYCINAAGSGWDIWQASLVFLR
jgi:Flp pilus assembly protein TadG